jgi:hypothetical protein
MLFLQRQRLPRRGLSEPFGRHAVWPTLFGQVTRQLPRFRCAACGKIDTGIGGPPHCRSTPELDRLQAHLCALMTYRPAADLLRQMFLVDAARHPETLRRHTLKVGAALGDGVATKPATFGPGLLAFPSDIPFLADEQKRLSEKMSIMVRLTDPKGCLISRFRLANLGVIFSASAEISLRPGTVQRVSQRHRLAKKAKA